MAMLAEPRRRKRYNLVPRGKALYEDENRFGTKMLEKMGWNKGEGLGANSTGSKDFVRIRYKNDSMGLGFEERDDQWTEHEQHFNGLLKNLNGENQVENLNKENVGSNDSESEMPPRGGFGFQETIPEEKQKKSEKLKEKISGISLEERSKKSKARVHYKKFTKGKDLAQYSEKDLANIFGKKAVNEEQEVNDFYKNLNNVFGIIEKEKSEEQLSGIVSEVETTAEENITKKKDKKKKKKEQDKGKDVEAKKESGKDEENIQPKTFTSNLSVQDYFKIKMEAFKNRKAVLNNEQELNNSTNEEPEKDLGKKKKKNKKKFRDLENASLQEPAEKKTKKSKEKSDQVNVSENKIDKSENIEKKKSKKRNIEETEERSLEKSSESDGQQERAEKKSKENKNKSNKNIPSETDIKTNSENTEESALLITRETEFKIKESDIDCLHETVKKKSKKNKSKPEPEAIAEVLEEVESKSKKNKSKNIIDSNLLVEDTITGKRKLEVSEADITNPNDTEETDLFTQENKRKKKKKDNKHAKEVIELSTSNKYEPIVTENQSSNASKKSKKEVSSSDHNFSENDVNLQENDIEELKKKYQVFNIYPISTFCAEKFRNINLNDFKGSALPQIEGYGLSPELQLKITESKNDEERIIKLWKCVLNKYEQVDKPKKTYNTYVRDAFAAYRKKKRPPKLYVKTWQRKNAFNIV